MSIAVVVAEAVREDIVDTIPLVGTLTANEAVEIKSEIDGAIEGIEFKEGEKVAAGRVLFRIDEKKLAASVARAQADFTLSKANLERAKTLHPVSLELVTLQRNERARRFYESRGFVTTKFGISPPPESEPDVHYRWSPST